jgi:hypothetical protein
VSRKRLFGAIGSRSATRVARKEIVRRQGLPSPGSTGLGPWILPSTLSLSKASFTRPYSCNMASGSGMAHKTW